MGVGRIPHGELRRGRRFTKASLDLVLAPWYESADTLARFHVTDLLADVVAGRWVERDWLRDTINPNVFHFSVPDRLVVSIRLIREYPGIVELIRIGRLSS